MKFFHNVSFEIISKSMVQLYNIQVSRLYSEDEWRGMGIQMSRGWQHYMNHLATQMCFRRPRGCNPNTGRPPHDWIQPKDDPLEWTCNIQDDDDSDTYQYDESSDNDDGFNDNDSNKESTNRTFALS